MQLTRLVDDLLDVARLTHARVALKLESVELDSVIDQAIETGRSLATEKFHELRIHRPGEKLYVSGDRARLVQTVTNLLHNAIKYTDPRGTITLAVSTTEQELVLSVQDTGVGISAGSWRTSSISSCRASALSTARKVGWASACPWPGTWSGCTTGRCRLTVPVSDRAPRSRSDCREFQPPTGWRRPSSSPWRPDGS